MCINNIGPKKTVSPMNFIACVSPKEGYKFTCSDSSLLQTPELLKTLMDSTTEYFNI